MTYYPGHRVTGWSCPPPPEGIIDFHRSLPGYAVTPLTELPGSPIGRMFAKDETSRLGLPAFKGLGASWALHRALADLPAGAERTIVTATDGNHGRAVAHFARLMGHRASIFMPTGVSPESVTAIESEGASVTVLDAPYDDAVARAAEVGAAPGHILVQDTAWPGYEQTPGWIVEGYDTLFTEIDAQLTAAGRGSPDLVLVPTGVGSLLQAALAHYRSAAYPGHTRIVAVESVAAPCVGASLRAGAATSVPTGTTIMAGLNCGTPSSLAWPYIQRGLDAAVSVTDEESVRAAYELADAGIAAGPCGAASLAALQQLVAGGRGADLGLGADSTIVALVTEGTATNPLPPR